MHLGENMIKKKLESTFTDFCTIMDKEAIANGFSIDWYYSKCYEIFEQIPDYIKDLLIENWTFRAKFGLNIVASFEGEQGSGKSLFALFWCYLLGNIFGKPFDIEKNLYVIPENLDNGLRDSDFRSTHFLDEQRNKNIGLGSISLELSLQDYEEQCRYTQKNILYASPTLHDHRHYFVFSSQSIERFANNYCAMCPPEIQAECYSKKFETNCPPEFVLLRGGEKIPFWERSGYPKRIIFLLKTKRKIDNYEVPRGFVAVPMPTPETVMKYDLIKLENLKKLESEEEDSFKYIVQAVDNFIKEHSKELVKMIGNVSEKTYKLKNEQGNPYLETKIYDNRKYSIVSANVIESLLYVHLKSMRKYTTKTIALMVAMVKSKMQDVVFEKNNAFFEEKKRKRKE